MKLMEVMGPQDGSQGGGDARQLMSVGGKNMGNGMVSIPVGGREDHIVDVLDQLVPLEGYSWEDAAGWGNGIVVATQGGRATGAAVIQWHPANLDDIAVRVLDENEQPLNGQIQGFTPQQSQDLFQRAATASDQIERVINNGDNEVEDVVDGIAIIFQKVFQFDLDRQYYRNFLTNFLNDNEI